VRFVAALALFAALPFVIGDALLPYLVLAAMYAMMALGLNIVVGFAGLLDLGYVAFYAIGAHVAAHLSSGFWANAQLAIGVDKAGVPGIHLNFLLVLAAAIALCVVAGVVIGAPTLRMHSGYVALVTLAFGEIVTQLVSNGREIRFLGGSLTGGPNGMTVIDRVDLPFLAPFGALDQRPWYWLALVLLALTVVCNLRLRASRPGRAWLAVRSDEEAAAAAGIPVARTKLTAYAAGAAFGGAAGAFLASYLSFANPAQFTFSFSIFILAMVVLGGLGSIPGVVIGAFLLAALNYYVLPHFPSLSEISSGIYGLVLVLVVLLRPDGIWPAHASARTPVPSAEPSPRGASRPRGLETQAG
jgi:branched-chain amino acid transport system permease protein